VNPERARWNEKHRARRGNEPPSIPLLMYLGRLSRGRALDLAGGGGENAAILALAGWQVTLLELSEVAIARARRRARELKADVQFLQAEALHLPFRGPFQTIVVARFLERAIAGELVGLLAPGGTLFLEQPMAGIREAFCVKPGELAGLFGSLEAVLDTQSGENSVFIGRKRP